MSEIKSSNVSWNNIKVDQYTDITSGYTYITLPGQTTKLAESSNANWSILDINLLTRTYNNANSTALTNEEVRTLFFRSGRLVYNDVRKGVINDTNNYDNLSLFNSYTLGMYNAGVPGAVNPNDGRSVNDSGKSTEYNVINTSVRTESTFQVRTQGSPPSVDTYQGPNDLTLSVTGNENTYKKSSKFGTLRYPAAIMEGMDYMSFQAFKYQANSTNLFEGGRGIAPEGRTAVPVGQSVLLPIPPGTTDNNGVGWGDGDTLNFIEGALGNAALGGINDGADAIINKGGNVLDAMGAAAKGTIKTLRNDGMKILGDDGLSPFIKSYFAGQAIGKNITARVTGQVINPNLELLFNGPSLRTFGFKFFMTPRDEDEAKNVRDIIKYFKTNMRPAKSGSGAFLYTPNVFKIRYIYNQGGEHPFMNRFKTCALKDCNVTYSPHGVYSTYEDGSLTQYSIELIFGELTPIYNDSEDNNQGGTGY